VLISIKIIYVTIEVRVRTQNSSV